MSETPFMTFEVTADEYEKLRSGAMLDRYVIVLAAGGIYGPFPSQFLAEKAASVHFGDQPRSIQKVEPLASLLR